MVFSVLYGGVDRDHFLSLVCVEVITEEQYQTHQQQLAQMHKQQLAQVLQRAAPRTTAQPERKAAVQVQVTPTRTLTPTPVPLVSHSHTKTQLCVFPT